MAFVDGYFNGEPAVIPDNFVQLWPEVYSLTPPEPDAGTAPAEPTQTEAPEGAADPAPAASKRKDIK